MHIVVAEGRYRVRKALSALLTQVEGVVIVGEVADAEELLAQAQEACPDLVLFDWDLPGTPSLELLNSLRRLCAGVKVIVLSGQSDVGKVALAAGANAFVDKGNPPDILLEAVRKCASAEMAAPSGDLEGEDPPGEGSR